jgi:anti-sigma regulatory factor (Ser/Thr protein kinase)
VTSVSAVGDIIFIALDNMYKHAGQEEGLKVVIEVSRIGNGRISIAVENELPAEFDREAGERKVAAIQAQIRKHEYTTAFVSGEGGTGLLKLKSLVDPAGEREDAVSFGFTESGTFRVTTVFRAIGVESENLVGRG